MAADAIRQAIEGISDVFVGERELLERRQAGLDAGLAHFGRIGRDRSMTMVDAEAAR